ncbi:MAG: hypothetical protein MSA07_05365 [Mucispirillum sp.]|uniref:Uncharacterized protein n=1 Tax=Candidatus Mucispirillum faecigallinarum TaxID=2838699 RepID=A0A9D2KD07_9BACT|nr:hypothetical protein [Mucispirillum sp.]HIZ90322.1 hypothetical protein [Candidatus Mucispirillum faecigallinarum]
MSEKDINTKQSFINLITRTMRSMELKVLLSGIDYSSPLPHLVAVYPDKEKYYLIEPISMECFSEESPRLYKQDEHKDVRQYCQRLFKDDHAKGAAVAAILCDLAAGVEMFTYKLVGTHELISMAKYACLAVPCSMEDKACQALDYLKLEYRPLNVLDKFTLILIDKVQTAKLPEIKKFIKFILNNK